MESKIGFWCAKHNEYSHGGVCRWCEPAKEDQKAAAPRPWSVGDQHRVAAYVSYGVETVYHCLCGFAGDFPTISEHVGAGNAALNAALPQLRTPQVTERCCCSAPCECGNVGWKRHCDRPIAWRWFSVAGDITSYFCEVCHADRDPLFADWRKTHLSGHAAPKETP